MPDHPKKRHTHSITPTEEESGIGRYLDEVVLHEHVVSESSFVWNAKSTNSRSSVLSLRASFKFFAEMQQDEVVNIVIKNHLLYVGIIPLR